MSYINEIKKSNVTYDIQDKRIPQAAVADENKVIKVDSTGAYVLGTGGGGTGGSTLYEHYVPLMGEIDAETGEAPVLALYFTNAYSGYYVDPDSGESMISELIQDLQDSANTALSGASKPGIYAAKGTYIQDAETGDGWVEMSTPFCPVFGLNFGTDPQTGEPTVMCGMFGAEDDGQGTLVPAILMSEFVVSAIVSTAEDVFSERYDPAQFPAQYEPQE